MMQAVTRAANIAAPTTELTKMTINIAGFYKMLSLFKADYGVKFEIDYFEWIDPIAEIYYFVVGASAVLDFGEADVEFYLEEGVRDGVDYFFLRAAYFCFCYSSRFLRLAYFYIILFYLSSISLFLASSSCCSFSFYFLNFYFS